MPANDNIRAALASLWHSATATTFGSFLVRSLGLVVLLPLVLVRLPAEEISVWYLFAAITSLQLLVDLGFGITFGRFVSYAMGGTGVHALASPQGRGPGEPDWEALGRVTSAMHYVYARLTLVWCLLLAAVGTLAVRGPIELVADPGRAWWAWTFMAVSSVIALRGTAFGSYLLGIDEVALVRRWDIATSVGSTLTGATALLLGGDLLVLVVAHQAWVVINVLRNRWLARTVLGGRATGFPRARHDAEVLAAAWPSVWRTGLGLLTGFALIQASGVIYAQVSSAAAAASYFLALRLIQAVSQFSQAPFYSQLPTMARLYAEGKAGALADLAQRSMGFAYLAFVVGFVALGVIGEPLLRALGSNVTFPDPVLWTLLGMAMLAERYGAMHVNLCLTANRAISHVANGGAGLIYLAAGIALFPLAGVYAFALALLAGNVGFYAAYSATRSYRLFGLDPWTFERRALVPYLGVVLLYSAAALMLAARSLSLHE